MIATLADIHGVSANQHRLVSIYPARTVPITPAEDDPLAVEVGVQFSVSQPGSVVGVRYYKSAQNRGTHVGSLWSESGVRLAAATFTRESSTGWQTVRFAQPVGLIPGTTYVASYHTSTGYYAQQQWAFAAQATVGNSTIRATRGVYDYGMGGFPHSTWHDAAYYVDVLFQPNGHGPTPSITPPSTSSAPPSTDAAAPSTPHRPTTSSSTQPPTSQAGTTPAPSQPPSTGTGSTPTTFPGPSNTGVPKGTELSPYTGPCTIKTATAITAKIVSCDPLTVAAGSVQISDSRLGRIDVESSGSASIQDSEIDAGHDYAAAAGQRNLTLQRVNAHGGDHSVQCSENCVVQDSWLHGQYLPSDGAWHLNAYISNGGHNVVLRHNTLSCDARPNSVGGGCSGDASIFGDFSSNSDYLFDGNLFVANIGVSYCLYAGYDPSKSYGTSVTNIVVKNNVFQRGGNGKCGDYGPVTSFQSRASGNIWTNNKWDDGTAVTP